ncbi:FMN-linked oxidoreductase [Parathielavia hyrcaniae]|uniref:Dihydroorotate dehydrogenase (fumarate) n=1 Tax=Parathielavia hyrcaniae TaxID=113614 RepID=A0AAN6Q6N8_9PEZI|nr:FMN-linked oxidoreductase [Parathielavia hyrcaniae]
MMGPAPPLEIDPPLINSACPWATTLEDLRLLHACPSTGAVTTRTSLINGFDHGPAKHQYAFFDAAHRSSAQNASLNSLGYSPLTLETYLGFIQTISDEQPGRSRKGFIVSVTGTPEDIAASYKSVSSAATTVNFPLAMEINLSCPNIPNRPPPAYSEEALTTYLTHLQAAISTAHADNTPRIPVGLKTPPYTYSTQFHALVSALEKATASITTITGVDARKGGGGEEEGEKEQRTCPISFITATNTLGSCLLFSSSSSSSSFSSTTSSPSPATPVLPGSGIGGMAGSPLHPLALGNVATLRRMLDESGSASDVLSRVRLVGVGGVLDAEGYKRMRAAGADFVGLATGLGVKGVGVFDEVGRVLGLGVGDGE